MYEIADELEARDLAKKVDFIALCKQLLDVIQEVRIEELAEQGLLLDKLPRQDQLLLRLWCDCLPLLLLNEVVDALYNVIVLYFHRFKYLHDLLIRAHELSSCCTSHRNHAKDKLPEIFYFLFYNYQVLLQLLLWICACCY